VNAPLIVLLAEGPKNTGPDFGKASPVGLLVVVLLLIAVFVLVWSMNRHLKKARDHFAAADGTAPPGPAAVVDGPGPAATVDGGGPAATREPSGEPGG
jgi:hypothetical protein